MANQYKFEYKTKSNEHGFVEFESKQHYTCDIWRRALIRIPYPSTNVEWVKNIYWNK